MIENSPNIPFNRPAIVGREIEYIKDAIDRRQLSGDGYYTDQCQKWLNTYIGGSTSLLTHSCTAALEMAVVLAGIEPGDEVIMPSYTFVSTANAVVLRGGIPVFVDIRSDTLNIDETLVERAITPRTKAIMVVHYAGVGAEMATLRKISDEHGLTLIEDAAQALGATYRGQPLGSLGDLAAISFHETKNVTCGEGGAIIVNDPSLVERAEIIREKGTNRKRFSRGEIDKYTWVDRGSSFLPGELNAAFLYGQLEMVADITQKRRRIWDLYDRELQSAADLLVDVVRPTIPENCEHNAHMYYIVVPTNAHREAFIAYMREHDVMTPFHYVPLHSSPAGRLYGRTNGPLVNTVDLAQRLVRLPLHYNLGGAAEIVIADTLQFLKR